MYRVKEWPIRETPEDWPREGARSVSPVISMNFEDEEIDNQDEDRILHDETVSFEVKIELDNEDFLRSFVTRDEDMFICGGCEAKYKRKDHLIRHIEHKHSDNNKNVCQHCQKTFRANNELQKHIEIEHMNVRYSCSQCPK